MTQTLEQLLEAVDKAGYHVFLLGNPLGQGWILEAVHKTEKIDGKPVYKTARGETAMGAAAVWVFFHGMAFEKAMQRNLEARRSIDVAAKRD